MHVFLCSTTGCRNEDHCGDHIITGKQEISSGIVEDSQLQFLTVLSRNKYTEKPHSIPVVTLSETTCQCVRSNNKI